MRRKVVLITDGDQVARRAVEKIAGQVGGRCISLSAGNPTPLSGSEIVELVKQTPYDPVLIMLDDRGKSGPGKGEQALKEIATHPEIEVLGVVAVASNTESAAGIGVDLSITNTGRAVTTAVDKMGNAKIDNRLSGDTVDILNGLNVPVIVGTGDTGKMDGADAPGRGGPITGTAVKEILRRSGYYGHQ